MNQECIVICVSIMNMTATFMHLSGKLQDQA